MSFHTPKRLLVAAAVIGVLAVVAAASFVALTGHSVVAGPDAAPPANPDPPSPGHSWSQIGDLPGTMWHSNNDGPGSGLDADTLDGQQPGSGGGLVAGTLSRLGFSTTTVDSTGNVGLYTSATVGTDGLPLVSYFDMTDWDLEVVHCGNAGCSAGNTITTVDSTGDPGSYGSITVGADGLPLISYLGSSLGGLKVAHCGNAACSASNTITTVDSTGNVGQYTSVTVGADGLPVISYYDDTNDDLKVAHCSNRLCVPYHRPR